MANAGGKSSTLTVISYKGIQKSVGTAGRAIKRYEPSPKFQVSDGAAVAATEVQTTEPSPATASQLQGTLAPLSVRRAV